MYTPPPFAMHDLTELHKVIEQHSFATLISASQSELEVTHLPLLLDRDRGDSGTLVGHMAWANGHWRAANGKPATAIFHGPHAYISPSWYEAENVVPTWNYVVVRARGTFRAITQQERLQTIVRRYVEHYESGRESPWSLDSVEGSVVDDLVQQIVGFEIVIDHIEGKWKLNQNHDTARRKRVVTALRAAGGEQQVGIADLMASTLRM